MTEEMPDAEAGKKIERLILGVDTCGPAGSVALARLTMSGLVTLGQTELAGRSYSATLVAAVGDLLSRAQTHVGLLHAIVVVHGPGSFTGVRVGLSAVKGLAEPAGIPVVAVSRLAVLAYKAGTQSAALDAHRHEVFLRIAADGVKPREILAGASDLAGMTESGGIAVCDESAAALLSGSWPGVRQVRVEPPNAADAMDWARPRIEAGEFADLALLDGHYLRRSDAEIFGEVAASAQRA